MSAIVKLSEIISDDTAMFPFTQEIEKLNEECLELEDQVQALKNEVKEAWGSYKTSQERAAIREAELQDELRQVSAFNVGIAALVLNI